MPKMKNGKNFQDDEYNRKLMKMGFGPIDDGQRDRLREYEKERLAQQKEEDKRNKRIK